MYCDAPTFDCNENENDNIIIMKGFHCSTTPMQRVVSSVVRWLYIHTSVSATCTPQKNERKTDSGT